MDDLNIHPHHNIVCYDNQGMFSVARVAWYLRFYGASNVRILNGGLKKWLFESRPIVSGE
jgi:thiosulfate/3-mercaptopyruvate sulfurtransferase